MDYYAILGCGKDASPPEIRACFLLKAKQCHPDKCNDSSTTETFQNLNSAYQVLGDPEKRREYDRKHTIGDSWKNGTTNHHMYPKTKCQAIPVTNMYSLTVHIFDDPDVY